MSIGEHEMRHDLLVYDSDDGFASYVALFVEEGIEAGQPVVVVTDGRRRAVLTDTLSGSDAAAMTFLDRDQIYTRPEAALAAYDATLQALLGEGAEAIRVYGELPFCREPEQKVVWQRYEAIFNHVFAGQPVWVTCGYDARLLPPHVVDDARRTHREVHAHGWRENPHYESAGEVVRSLAPTADALTGLRSLPLIEDEGTFRRLLERELARDGVSADAATRMLTASLAVLVNAQRHGGGLRGLRAGRTEDLFVCEITDGGRGLDDPFAGYTPPHTPADPAGLWTARQLTTRLDLLSSDSGLTVRLWV